MARKLVCAALAVRRHFRVPWSFSNADDAYWAGKMVPMSSSDSAVGYALLMTFSKSMLAAFSISVMDRADPRKDWPEICFIFLEIATLDLTK